MSLSRYFLFATLLDDTWHKAFCSWLSKKLDPLLVFVPFLESSCHLFSVVYQIPYAKILFSCVLDGFVIDDRIFPIASFNPKVGQTSKRIEHQ
jgi:hypothetical protein